MLATAFAALLLAAPLPVSVHATPPEPAKASQDSVRLEDLTVTGRPLDRMINSFISEVAAPNSGRTLARWRQGLCFDAVNMPIEDAADLVDRVSTVARDVGLRIRDEGCAPNVIVILTSEPDRFTQNMIGLQPRAFRVPASGMDRGSGALRAFMSSDRPIRWWQIVVPVDNESGVLASRVSGEPPQGGGGNAMTSAPILSVFAASRLTTQIVNDIYKSYVIIDSNQVKNVSPQQLADYIAMVALAQINPDADTSRYASILNLFDGNMAPAGLTEWDRAYLKGLYKTQRTQQNLASSRMEIAASIQRAHRSLTSNDEQ